MDENPLSNQQQMQAALVSKAYLQDTAREQQRKLEQLEAMYAVAHNGLVSFLTLLDPDFIDTCLKQGQLVNKLDDRIVPQRVLAAIKKRKEKAGLPEGNHLEQGVPEPNWMTTWRQTKTLARDSVFLCLIGETGLSRQPSIKKLAAEKLDLRVDNGSLRKPVERMSDPDGPYLIEGIEDFEKAGSTAGALYRSSSGWRTGGGRRIGC